MSVEKYVFSNTVTWILFPEATEGRGPFNGTDCMRSRIYASVGRPSVCPFFCSNMSHSSNVCCCETLLLWPGRQEIDRLLCGAQQHGVRRAHAGSATFSAYVVAQHRLRGVHGNGEDWDPMGPMGFPWEWE